MKLERDILNRFVAGNHQAYRTIYETYYFRVYQYAKKILSNDGEAEDITADTFVKLWHKRSGFDTMPNIEGFLITTARNACFDRLKHHKVVLDKEPEIVKEYAGHAYDAFGSLEVLEELMEIVYAEAEKLPKKMREIFLLSFREGLSPTEIADKLQLSVQTVSNQKTHALKLLRLALADKNLAILIPILLQFQREFQQFVLDLYTHFPKK